jgi:hypothetical protein
VLISLLQSKKIQNTEMLRNQFAAKLKNIPHQSSTFQDIESADSKFPFVTTYTSNSIIPFYHSEENLFRKIKTNRYLSSLYDKPQYGVNSFVDRNLIGKEGLHEFYKNHGIRNPHHLEIYNLKSEIDRQLQS